MKKIALISLLVLALLANVVIFGCGKKAEEPAATDTMEQTTVDTTAAPVADTTAAAPAAEAPATK